MENDNKKVNKYTPIVIFIAAVILIDIIIIAFASSSRKVDNNAAYTESYDKTAGTTVESYTGAVTQFQSISALSIIADTVPGIAYSSLNDRLSWYTTLAFPDDQFSYKKDTLTEGPEDGYHTFQIASKNRTLTIRYSVVGDNLAGFTVTNANGAELYAYTANLDNSNNSSDTSDTL